MLERLTFTVTGSYGDVIADAKTGAVLRYDPGLDFDPDQPDEGYGDIARCDVAEWKSFYAGESLNVGIDIIDIGFWTWAGDYFRADVSYRKALIDCGRAATFEVWRDALPREVGLSYTTDQLLAIWADPVARGKLIRQHIIG